MINNMNTVTYLWGIIYNGEYIEIAVQAFLNSLMGVFSTRNKSVKDSA